MVENENDKKVIIDLFFNKYYKMEQLVQHFNNKYYEYEIRTIIKEHIKKYV